MSVCTNSHIFERSNWLLQCLGTTLHILQTNNKNHSESKAISVLLTIR